MNLKLIKFTIFETIMVFVGFVFGILLCHIVTFKCNSIKLNKLSDSEIIINSIKDANNKTGLSFSYTYCSLLDNNPIYELRITSGDLTILSKNGYYDSNVSDNLEVILLAIDNLPHFAFKYAEYINSKINNNLEASGKLLEVIRSGEIKTELGNKTDK